MMLNEDRLKAHAQLKWYEDGRMEFSLPNDPMIAYAILHCALDEVQERIMKLKETHQTKRDMVLVPNNGKMLQEEWGK